jgi:diguanylate cyclase (GGDEF)-like protein/PAS domain S-box-containing protein/putative nucleotidyltransferase with HDIG domain
MIMCGLFVVNNQNNSMFDSIINRWQGMYKIINQPALLINKENEILCNNIVADKLIGNQNESAIEVIKKILIYSKGSEPVSFRIDASDRWFSVKTSDYDVKKQYITYLLIDITELNIYQEKIRLSEQNYRTFFETMDDIITIGTKEGNIIYVNNAARSKLGYSTDEFIEMHILDIHPKENRQEAEEIFNDMFNGKRNSCPLPLLTKNGEMIPVETRVWFGEWDGRECVFGLSKDLSNEQEALLKFNKFFDNNPALMAVSSLSSRQFLDVNAAFINKTGYSKDEIIGKTSTEMGLFIMPDKQRAISYELEKFGKISNYELKIRTKSGEILEGLFSGEIIKSQGKKYFLTVMIDITKRKKAEEEKIKQSQLIISLLDSIPDLIFYKDINGVYLGCNQQFEKFVGKSKNEIVGKTDIELFDLDTAEMFRHNDEEMFKLNMSRKTEEVIIYPDGKSIIVDTIKTPYLDSEGNIIGIIGVSRDISDKIKAENKISYLTFHDQLTGLYNRRYYEKELTRFEGEQGAPLTLMMADVNGLKLTNDAFGQKAGDLLLQKAANILKNASGAEDIVARIGGDEFVILLHEANSDRANSIIDNVNKAIENEKTNKGILSVSIGYAIKGINEDINKVFKRAEDEMYRYKLSDSLSMRHKTIDLILNTLYEKNQREMIHSKRVGELCEAIALEMDFDTDAVKQIRIAGLMHDIGKIGIDDKILNKSEPLSREEWIINKQHAEIGYRILGSVSEFSIIASFVLAHHERWDGEGYPNGIKGEDIPIQSRIIAIADSYDAMMNDRPYRQAKQEDEVIDEIIDCSGSQFDPEIVNIFINKVLKKNKLTK